MIALKIFTQPGCARCPAAKKLGDKVADEGTTVEHYDISGVDGLAEANMYNIQATPSLILVDSAEDELVGWRGDIPAYDELKNAIEEAASS